MKKTIATIKLSVINDKEQNPSFIESQVNFYSSLW